MTEETNFFVSQMKPKIVKRMYFSIYICLFLLR